MTQYYKHKILKFPQSKGSYHHIKIDKNVVDECSNGNKTRMICVLNNSIKIQCGFNHYGDGNYYIIISKKNLKSLDLIEGNYVNVKMFEDPNKLGVDIPEVLLVLIEQEPELKEIFNQLTDGSKRTLIHTIKRVKNIDTQILKTREFLLNKSLKQRIN